MNSDKDTLFLLQPGFKDAVYPGKPFYCEQCATVEGVLVSFPELARKLDVKRVDFPRPRAEVIALVGEQHQSLPLLVLAKGETSSFVTGTHNGISFVLGRVKILQALSERHGFPEPHP